MSVKKRLYTVGTVATATALLVAGCGQGNTASTNSTNNASGASQAPVTIRMGTWDSGVGLTADQQVANNYMKLHPNVKIQVEAVPDNYGTKILTEVAAGDAPDIFQIGDGDVSMYASKGALDPLGSYISGSNGIDTSDYYTNVLDIGQVNGKLYTLPKNWGDLEVYYNKTLFDKAGVPYPKDGWTWQQFEQVAKKLTVQQNGKTVQWGANLPGAWTRAVYPIVNAFGGNLASADATKFVGYMDSSSTANALQFYGDMYFKYGISPTQQQSAAFQGVDLFQTGKVAMNITSTWPLDQYKATPNLKFGVVQLPVGPAGAANTICYAGYGLYAQSKNKAAAWDFLKYLTGAPGETVEASLGLSAMKSVAQSTGQLTDPYLKTFFADVPNIKPLPEVTSANFNNSGGKVFQDFLNKLMLNKVSNVQSELHSDAQQATQLESQAQ